jgi:outer membrane beta-barrel protein
MRRVRTLLAVTALLAVAAVDARAQPQEDAPAAPADAAAVPTDPAAADGAAFLRIEERAPRAGTPLIANKLYPMSGRFELGLTFDTSFGDKYVDHIGGHANVGYHLFDWLAVEAFGGYLFGDETGIVQNVRLDGKSAGLARQNAACRNPGCEPQLPDMWQTTWFAGGNVQWSPIYGKLSAVSEYDLNFQLYARLGGGVEGIQRRLADSSFSDNVAGAGAFPGFGTRLRPSLNYGVGVRLIPWKFLALRAELVNVNGLNPNVEEHDQTDENSCRDGYVLRSGNANNCLIDFSQSTQFQLGLTFLL